MRNIEKIWESDETVFINTEAIQRADDGTFRKVTAKIEVPKYRIVVIREDNDLDTVTRERQEFSGLEIVEDSRGRRQLRDATAEQWVVTVSRGARCGRGLARWSTGYAKNQGQWVK